MPAAGVVSGQPAEGVEPGLTFASFTLLEVDFRTGSTFRDRARGLQQQLRSDLRHQDISGVEVLRELMRLQGGLDQALMPWS
ncbi:hypothetical protein OG468_04890 [Streptomyces zaomyceticus]|uniref:STAS domain-containing protein n=1 Tax=Streptomyces zaomyceticus TaxID=68286 RepID=A0ABZ1LLM9_9ACTN